MICLVLGLAALAPTGPRPAAAAGDIFTVQDVPVDVTGESAAGARETALARGHRKALRRLLERLVPRDLLDRVPELPQERLVAMVRDFEVKNERTSTVRYLADLTFRFKPAAVRGFLRNRSIPFAETRSKPVLVLPVYGAAGDAALWQEPNPWRMVWARRAEQPGLVPLIVPLGDLGDMRTVTAQEALRGEAGKLDAIAARYDASDVLVTQALPAGDAAAGNASVQVITRRHGTPGQERTVVDSLRQVEDETLEGLLARAADAVAEDVEEAWKQANLLRFESRRSLDVMVPLDGLEAWLEVRRRLRDVAFIGSMNLTAMSRRRAELEITYYGERDQLDLALAQSDLRLEPVEDGPAEWRLRPAGAAGGDADEDEESSPAAAADGSAETATSPATSEAGEQGAE